MRDREGLFNEYILEVRRREKDEKIQKKETVSMKWLISFQLYKKKYEIEFSVKLHKIEGGIDHLVVYTIHTTFISKYIHLVIHFISTEIKLLI